MAARHGLTHQAMMPTKDVQIPKFWLHFSPQILTKDQHPHPEQ